ncbi:MAG: hypothetical protein M9894_31795 [Planctomycetes bacterium]|nr:hypothetical protein [Planctomycetota bacterium]
MPDDRLRDRARDAERGDPDARARLLVERVRSGALAPERLRLAAHLGDEAAGLALGEADDGPGDLVAWAGRLAGAGREALVRAFVAVARLFPPPHASVEAALVAAEAWCEGPDPVRAAAAHEAAVLDSYAQSGAAYLGGVAEPSTLAWWCPHHVALIASGREALAPGLPDPQRAVGWFVEAVVAAARALGAAQVRRAIADRLVPWALDDRAAFDRG